MLGVEEAIISVLVSNEAKAGEVTVVNPNFGRCVNIDQIFALRCAVN